MVARRHHFIPRCYLKGFAVERKKKAQIIVFDRSSGESYQTALDNVAVERDFNRVEIDGQPPDAFEGSMAQFEGDLGPALERIIAARSINDAADRNLLFHLMGLAAVHNPWQRESWRLAQEQTVRTIGELITSSPEAWRGHVERARNDGFIPAAKDIADDYEKMKEFIDKGAYRVEVPTERHLEQEMTALDTILPLLERRRWMVIAAADDTGGFVTSDHPVCLMWAEPERRGKGFYPPGFGLTGTQVVFPVSHRLAIMGGYEIESTESEGDLNLVAAINSSIIGHAGRQVLARDMHFHYSVAWKQEPRKASRLASEQWFRREGGE
jgi:hypothetical protein